MHWTYCTSVLYIVTQCLMHDHCTCTCRAVACGCSDNAFVIVAIIVSSLGSAVVRDLCICPTDSARSMWRGRGGRGAGCPRAILPLCGSCMELEGRGGTAIATSLRACRGMCLRSVQYSTGCRGVLSAGRCRYSSPAGTANSSPGALPSRACPFARRVVVGTNYNARIHRISSDSVHPTNHISNHTATGPSTQQVMAHPQNK